MEKRKLRKTVNIKYKFECLELQHQGKYLMKYVSVGYIILERRSKDYALKQARLSLHRKVDNVRLVSKITTEKVLSQYNPDIQRIILEQGETIESEELL